MEKNMETIIINGLHRDYYKDPSLHFLANQRLVVGSRSV